MIKYDLVCDAHHTFDGWFSNSAAFDAQAKNNLITCPVCGSTAVSKAIMAPAVSAATRKKGSTDTRPHPSHPGPAHEGPTTTSPAGGLPSAAPISRAEPPQDRTSAMTTMPSPETVAKLVTVMREVRKAVEANAENVGNKFAEEARKIHYGETDERAIYGEATADDAIELIEEGIAVQPLPVLPEDKN
ncbi:MAG: DUF1178 family protein [Pseudomonadota bacterium]